MPLLLTSYSQLPIQRIDSLASSPWFGMLVLVMLVALALSISAHRKQYVLYLRNIVNTQGRIMNYDTESTSVWANILLWFVVISIYTLLINSCLTFLKFNILHLDISTYSFFWIFAGMVLYFLSKWLLFRFLGYLFAKRDVAQAFTIDYFVIVATSGLILLPLILGMIYTLGHFDLVWLFAMLFVAFWMLITLFIKLLQFFYSGISSLFYIFLYLCTSEILPLLVAAKAASIVVNMV